MTQLFLADGTVEPATVIKAGPCVVVQAKTAPTDGYEAVQLGLVDEQAAKANKATAGHYKKANVPPTRVRREVKRRGRRRAPKPGDQVLVARCSTRASASTSSARARAMASRAWSSATTSPAAPRPTARCSTARPARSAPRRIPSRVVKGMRCGGHMGGDRVTVRNLKVLRIDADNNLLVVRGAVPGRQRRLRAHPQGHRGQARTAAAAAGEAQEGQEVGRHDVDVVNAENKKVGSVELSDDVFGGRVKTDLIHDSVVRANAAERRGTHATKTAAMVSGSGKKPWRQKGTGRARVGEIRNPLWRKGGTVFGPQPRSYAFTAPKKVERGALRAALAQKAQDGDLVIVDALAATAIKTKAAAAMLKATRRARQGAAHRRAARREAVAVAAQPPGREVPGELAHDRARRHGYDQGRADAVCGREAAVGARRLGGRTDMKLTDVIRRPLITEKTTVMPRRRPDAGVRGGAARQQDRRQACRREAAGLEGGASYAPRSRTAR